MADGCSVSIIGGIARSAELIHTTERGKLIKFSMRWNQRKMDKDGNYYNKPHYYRVKCWFTYKEYEAMMPLMVKGNEVSIMNAYLDTYKIKRADGTCFNMMDVMVENAYTQMKVSPRWEKRQPRPDVVRYDIEPEE